jgi:hypothetical protein
MKNKQIFWHNFFSLLYLGLLLAAAFYLQKKELLRREIPWFDFVILILAVFRLVRLFVYDSVTEHIRGYLGKFENGPGRELSMLVNCPWCTGVWAGLFAGFIYFLSPLAWFFLLVLALAGAGSSWQIIIGKIGRE